MTKKTYIILLVFAICSCASRQTIFGTYSTYKSKQYRPDLYLTLQNDSTFSFDYRTHPNGYKTCGTFRMRNDSIILNDLQDPISLIYEVNCITKTRTRFLKDTTGELAIKGNLWTQFDTTGHLVLIYRNGKIKWPSKKMTLTRSKKTTANSR